MVDSGGLLALGIHAVTAWTGLGGQAALKQAAHQNVGGIDRDRRDNRDEWGDGEGQKDGDRACLLTRDPSWGGFPFSHSSVNRNC